MAVILVIDDSADFKCVIFDYLLMMGYQVLNADNGRDGVKTALEAKPDLILMDVMMPDMGGMEALKELSAEDETRNIPVFIVTGSAFDTEMGSLFKQEPNCREFLDKTISLALLNEKITAALESRKGRQ
jgi:twitching motility two-component system response regulator PilH